MYPLISGFFMGWSLGSNDSSNIFGTAVASKAVKFRTAVILASFFIVIGALMEGQRGMHTLGGLTSTDLTSAVIASTGAALTVFFMTLLKLPVSTSQAMVGGIIASGVLQGEVNLGGLSKVFAAWVGTPIGAALIVIPLYFGLAALLNRLPIDIFQRDKLLKIGLLGAGSYGAYALGANNVANVTGVFASAGLLAPREAAFFGSLSMAAGVITFSKRVMFTVGNKLVRLDTFTALVAVLAEAITVHFYAKMGVPVSTSQAIIGAVLGIGLIKGMQTIQWKTLFNILVGWVGTPLTAFGLAWLLGVIVQ